MKTSSLVLILSLLPAALFGSQAPAVPSNGIPGGNQSATYVITKPGYYFLMGDRTMTDTSKNGIEIDASDVTLDLGGNTLRYTGVVGSGTAIHGKDVHNVEVRNGAVGIVPWDGVSLTATGANGVSNIRVIDIRASAIGHTGIAVEGNAALVDRCTVDTTGFSGISSNYGSATVISNCTVSIAQNMGIDARSVGVTVRNSSVQNANSIGIWITRGTVADCQVIACNKFKQAGSAGIYVSDNFSTIKNTTVASCYIMGIYVSSGHSVVEGNVIAGTLTAGDAVAGEAIHANGAGVVLAVNNRYSAGTTFTPNVTNVGNTAF